MTAPKTRVLTPADLRARRLELGISAVRVADSLGVRVSDIGLWERGEAVPDILRWRLLAGMLHIDEEEPLRPLPRQGEPDIVIDMTMSDPFIDIIDRAAPNPALAHLRGSRRSRFRR